MGHQSLVFERMNLSPEVLRGIQAKGFETPSEVQMDAIPALLASKDCVANSPSGSGKTLAFAVPALQLLTRSPTPVRQDGLPAPRVLIITPTGVLAEQITDEVRSLSRFILPAPRIALLTAGTKLSARSLDMVVATPYRLLDLLGLSGRPARLSLDQIELVVLDEADELLDKSEFRDQLQELIRQLPTTATMSYFSATLSRATRELIKQENLVRSDKVVYVNACDGVRPRIAHFHVSLGDCPEDRTWEEKSFIIQELCDEFQGGAIIIFARSKVKRDFLANAYSADRPGSRFTTDGHKFLDMKNGIFLATDAHSRGFDVHHVAVVFSFEPAMSPALYTQRVGRAGRFGRSGTAITLVDENEERDLQLLELSLGYAIPHLSADVSTLPGAGTGESVVQMTSSPPPLAQNPAPTTPTSSTLLPTVAKVSPGVISSSPALAGSSVSEIVEGLMAHLVPLVTTLVQEQISRLEENLNQCMDSLVNEVQQQHVPPQSDPELLDKLNRMTQDVADVHQQVVGLVQQRSLLERVIKKSIHTLNMDSKEGDISHTSSLKASKAQADSAEGHMLSISPGQSISSLTSVDSSSSTSLTTRKPETIETGQRVKKSTELSWASRVIADHPTPTTMPTKYIPPSWQPLLSPKVKSLGKRTLHPNQIRKDQRFRGQVVKVLKNGQCFICFGDDEVRCEKDGLARAPAHGGPMLKVGDWANVSVLNVIPPHYQYQDGNTSRDRGVASLPSPRWRIELALVP